jgi:hypothetical protein
MWALAPASYTPEGSWFNLTNSDIALLSLKESYGDSVNVFDTDLLVDYEQDIEVFDEVTENPASGSEVGEELMELHGSISAGIGFGTEVVDGLVLHGTGDANKGIIEVG